MHITTLGNATEASYRTKVVRNNLNPIWEDVFNLYLPLPTNRSESNISDFPTYRIEIFDMTSLGMGSFLGTMSLNPSNYFDPMKQGVFGLSSSQMIDKKSNKLIIDTLNQGINPSIELKWEVVDEDFSGSRKWTDTQSI